MKYSIRQRVLVPVTGLMVTKVEFVNGELGSGVYDRNGKEIFEGDIVTNGRHNLPVKFINGALFFYDESKAEGHNINPHFAQGFEIIGHDDD